MLGGQVHGIADIVVSDAYCATQSCWGEKVHCAVESANESVRGEEKSSEKGGGRPTSARIHRRIGNLVQFRMVCPQICGPATGVFRRFFATRSRRPSQSARSRRQC